MSDNQLIPTEDYESAYETLDEIYRFAIDGRIDGMRHRAIAQVVKRTEQTVKEWFAKDGRLYPIYQWKKRQRRQESRKLFKQIREQLEDAAIDATVTLKTKARKGDVIASLGILRTIGFEAPKKVEVSGNPDRPVFYIPDNGRDKTDH
jgi:hypothetical protein